jgi:membrane fusion protein (multidrug efflux system)
VIRRWDCALVFASVVALGCRPPQPPGGAAPERVTNVQVEEVTPGLAEDRLELPATVEAWSCVRLSAEVDGRIETVAKQEGDRVNANEVLFQIDDSRLKAQLASAQAQQVLAERSFQRAKQLREQNAISQAELDRAEADLKVAEAGVELAGVMHAKTTVRSPIQGIFNKRLMDRGEFVGPGTPLCEVVNTDRVKVVLAVPEKDIPFVRTGCEMKVACDAIRAERTGTVIYQSTSADPRTLTFTVKVDVDNADGALRPGMIARVELIRRRAERAVTVPIFAVIKREDGYVVFVENGGRAHEQPVDLGFFDGERVVVTKGLEAGARLIVVGQRELLGEDKVRVVTPTTGPASAPATAPATAPADGTDRPLSLAGRERP